MKHHTRLYNQFNHYSKEGLFSTEELIQELRQDITVVQYNDVLEELRERGYGREEIRRFEEEARITPFYHFINFF